MGTATPAALRLRGLRISQAPPDDAPVAQGHNVSGSRVDFDSVLPTKAGLDRHHDLVAVLDELVGADGDLIEHVQEGAPEISGGLAPAIDAHLDASGARPIHLDVGVEIAGRPVQVALIEGV